MLLASRHSFLLEDTKVVFNGCWPHAYSPCPVECALSGPQSQPSRQWLWGGEKPALPSLAWAFPAKRRNLFWLGASHPEPYPSPWTLLLAEGGSLFFFTVAASLRVLHPERGDKRQSLQETLVEASPLILLKTWCMDRFQFLRFLAHASFLRLLICFA